METTSEGFLPCLVVMLLAAGYLPLRQVGGIWTGVFMPLLLSSYESPGSKEGEGRSAFESPILYVYIML